MQHSDWELGKVTYTKTWTKTFRFLIPNCLMIVADRSRNYTMSISRPRPRTNISVSLDRRDEFTVAIIQNTANSNNKDLWQIQNVRSTWKYHPKTFTPPWFVQFCSKRTKQNSLLPISLNSVADVWVDAYVRKTPRVQSSNKERGGLHLSLNLHHHPAHQTTSYIIETAHLAIIQNEKKKKKTATQTNTERGGLQNQPAHECNKHIWRKINKNSEATI